MKDGTLRWRATTRRPPNNAPAVGKVYGWILGRFGAHMDLSLEGLPGKVMKQPLLSIQDWNFHETYWKTNKIWWQICWLIKWIRTLLSSCCPVIFYWTSSHRLSFKKRFSFKSGIHDHVGCALYTVYCIWCNIVLDISWIIHLVLTWCITYYSIQNI